MSSHRAALAAFVAAGLGALGCAAVGTHHACSTPYPHCQVYAVEPDAVVANTAVRLRREYWAVAKTGDRAYMFPRPDGFETIAAECSQGGPHAALFARNALCVAAASEADVARVNSMTLDDALAVSTFLHERLRFTRVPGGTSISPYPYVDDELGVCDENPDVRAGVLREVCDRAYRIRDDPDGTRALLARMYTDAEADALPPLLDRYYGVSR